MTRVSLSDDGSERRESDRFMSEGPDPFLTKGPAASVSTSESRAKYAVKDDYNVATSSGPKGETPLSKRKLKRLEKARDKASRQFAAYQAKYGLRTRRWRNDQTGKVRESESPPGDAWFLID